MSQEIRLWKISLLLLLGLYVFLYIVSTTVADVYFIITEPAAGITLGFSEERNQVVIEYVVPKSPAENAGLQKGDALLTFNNHPITSAESLAEVHGGTRVGDRIDVTILRSGQQSNISFHTESRLKVYTKTFVLSFLPSVIFCYTLILIGMFVLFNKLHDRTAYVFYLMVLFWALAMWGEFPYSSDTLFKKLPDWFMLIRLLYWPLAVGLLLHFTLIFPVERETFQRRPRLYLLICYGSILLFIPFVYAESHGLKWGESLLVYGRGIWFAVNFFLAMTMLGSSVAKAPTPIAANQARIMYYGTMLTLALPTGLYFVPKLLGKSIPYSENFLFALVLWPMVLAYAIIKHRFMDIDVFVKRGVAYALSSGFVVAAYFLLVVGVGKLVLYLTGSSSQFVTIVATLIIAAAFNPVRNRIRTFVDLKFYPGRFIYREAVRAFSHQLVKVVDLQKLLDLLQTFLADTMHIQQIIILWKTDDGLEYRPRSSSRIESLQSLRFSRNDAVIEALSRKPALLDLSPFPSHLSASDDEKAHWQNLQTEIVLPLLSKGSLIGAISLGPKTKDEPYYKEDLELLETLGDQINIALENALLTEELRQQERLKKELEVARRIQLSSLPQSDPQVHGLEVTGISIPALEVGGDYYDYLDFPDGRFGVVVGDVSGKGTSAALYMSQLKGILKTAAKFHDSVKELMTEVNALTFGSIAESSFITVTCGVFDLKKRNLHLVRAGHLPLIHYSAKKKSCARISPKGIGIGLENGRVFQKELEEKVVPFHSGDIFLFYTDGVVETRDKPEEELEGAMLMEILQQDGWHSAYDLREKIVSTAHSQFDASSQKDDMTLVVVRVL